MGSKDGDRDLTMAVLLRQRTQKGDQSWMYSQLHYLLKGTWKMAVNRQRGPLLTGRLPSGCLKEDPLPVPSMEGAGTPAGELRPRQWGQWEWREEARREDFKGVEPTGVVMEKERRQTPRFRPWALGEGELMLRQRAQVFGEDPRDV